MSEPVPAASVTVLPTAAAPLVYPDRPNALQSTKTSIWMWVSLLLGSFLMLWLAMFATRHNPLYSDVATNGISKYRFIEQCKEAISAEVAKETAKQPGVNIDLGFNARDLVNGVSNGFQAAVPAAATATPATPGWTLIAPMQVKRAGYPTQTATLGCHYDKASNQTTLIQ